MNIFSLSEGSLPSLPYQVQTERPYLLQHIHCIFDKPFNPHLRFQNVMSRLKNLLWEQARKSSEDAQATRYAQFEKVWAG